MAHPHIELIATSRQRIAKSAARVRQSTSRLRVVHADPNNPPPAPPGSHAVAVKDPNGTVISWGWCLPSVDRDLFFARAFAWKEVLEAMPACALHREV